MNSLLISRYSNIYLRNRKCRYSIERDEQVTRLDRIDKSVKRVPIDTFEPIIERERLLKTFPVLNINRDSPRGWGGAFSLPLPRRRAAKQECPVTGRKLKGNKVHRKMRICWRFYESLASRSLVIYRPRRD